MDLLKSVHADITEINTLIESVEQAIANTPRRLFELRDPEDPWGGVVDPTAKIQHRERKYAEFKKGQEGGANKVPPPAPSIPVRDKTIVITVSPQGMKAGIFRGDERGEGTIAYGDGSTGTVRTTNIRPVRDDDAEQIRRAAETLRQKNPNRPIMVVQTK